MTAKDIIKHLVHWVDNDKYPFQVSNCFMYEWECDYWAMDTEGITREFEVKISRQDYFRDRFKEKHNDKQGANYFYYVVPKNLITPAEVNPKYGLIYIWETGHVSIEKKPRKLHEQKFESWKMLARKMYWKFRELWRKKWVDKEITRDEYYAGFNLELEKEEMTGINN